LPSVQARRCARPLARKICWFGANWRSFLPKSKGRVENSSASNSKRGVPTAIPQVTAEPAPLPVEVTDVEKPQELPALRQATPMEAAALINADAQAWDLAPPAVPDQPQLTVARHGMTEMSLIFGTLAIGSIGFVMIICKRNKGRAKQQLSLAADGEQRELECLPVRIPLAPSLIPSVEHQLLAVPSWMSQARSNT
jgi:hypothetical protein